MSTVLAEGKVNSFVLMEESPDGEIQNQFHWPPTLSSVVVVLGCLIN